MESRNESVLTVSCGAITKTEGITADRNLDDTSIQLVIKKAHTRHKHSNAEKAEVT